MDGCARLIRTRAGGPVVTAALIAAWIALPALFVWLNFFPKAACVGTAGSAELSGLLPGGALPRLQSPVRGDKWIVVTTIHPPTPTVKKLASLDGWNVVVVGDSKSPRDWNISCSSCVYLDVETQMRLPFRIARMVPLNHYGRKNIGYMYAIASGARVIYETDDDNSLQDAAISYVEEDASVHVYDVPERTIVNPYHNFGLRRAWPRGYPLGIISNRPHKSFVLRRARPLVQQGLANGDPDMDAIYRLTRAGRGPGNRKAPIYMEFDSACPPLALPPRTLTPYNSQNTVFLRDALWALIIPISTNFRVCDIWRGYWTQRLLWDVGGVLAFTRPSVIQRRNIHDYMRDFVDEMPLYLDAQRLADFLFDWRPAHPTHFERMRQMARDMHAEGFWGAADVDLMDAWVSDLRDQGYIEPTVLEHLVPGATTDDADARVVLEPRVGDEIDVDDFDAVSADEFIAHVERAKLQL